MRDITRLFGALQNSTRFCGLREAPDHAENLCKCVRRPRGQSRMAGPTPGLRTRKHRLREGGHAPGSALPAPGRTSKPYIGGVRPSLPTATSLPSALAPSFATTAKTLEPGARIVLSAGSKATIGAEDGTTISLDPSLP